MDNGDAMNVPDAFGNKMITLFFSREGGRAANDIVEDDVDRMEARRLTI
jgi:hypothetical protein